MNRFIKKSRIVVIFILLAALTTVYAATLFDMQLSENGLAAQSTADSPSYSSYYTVYANRGDILDRNGVLLVSSKPVYNVELYRTELLKSGDPNGNLFRLVETAKACGVEYTDTFPITSTAPFEYAAEMTASQTSRLAEYLDYFGLDTDISASDLIIWLRDHYGIDYTVSINDARQIIGLRYELELRVIINISAYVFAEDVSQEFITSILDQNIAGVHISTRYERQYHTPYAAHLLGYMGKMNAEEYEVYAEQNYSMDASVGKAGMELAFEQYLHGTDGACTVTYNAYGEPIRTTTVSEAQAGGNVYTTLDINLQAAAEEALAEKIAALNATREDDEELATGGAVVVVDVSSGETLACASNPTYDLATFRQNIAQLNEDETRPMWNRATQGLYNPGSTFKMVTSYAGLKTGTISPDTYIYDEHTFTKYPDFQPSCWSPTSHGYLNVVGALRDSCNFFFYWLGDTLGIDAINSAAAQFGLGSSTGIEVGDVDGHLATPEYKQEALNEGWWAADNLLAAIGEGYGQFTPVQLADYVAAIANGGTVYKLTLLDKVVSADYTTVTYQSQREVRSTVDDSEGYIEVLQQGMEAVASEGTASEMLADYDIKVAAKTGTTQSDTSSVNTGVFVCYAPADAPEIAIAVVVENGGSGSALTDIAKDILDAYFSSRSSGQSPSEGALIQ